MCVKPHKKECDLILDDSNENDAMIINALYSEKLFGETYQDYNKMLITSDDINLLTDLGTAFSGKIENNNISEPKYPVKDLSCLKHFTSLTSLVPTDESGSNKNLFGAKYLETISLPNSITTLDTFSFAFCMNLRNIDLGSITAIKTKSFYFCINLYSINIPDTVEIIEANAFAKSKNLKVIDMASSKPCKVYKDTFAGINPDFIVKVPKGSIDSYKGAWKYVDPTKFIEK